MSEEKKKGFLSKLFGPKKSGCCDVKIEEIIDEAKEALKKKQDKIEKASERNS
jgi:hypothetical protein